MTEGAPAGSPRRPKRSRRRRWLLGAAVTLTLFGGLYAVARAAFLTWMHAAVPDNAPRIAFSLDDTWLNELGVTDTTYQQAITRAGGRLVRVLPDSAGTPVDPNQVDAFLLDESIDAVLLTGGGDVDPALYSGESSKGFLVNRQRDDFEIALIRAARKRRLPVLGVCRGCQILNVAFGGALRNLRDDDDLSGKHFSLTGHAITLEPDSRLAHLLGVSGFDSVRSFHGQAVGRLGQDVAAAATGDGDIVEAIEVDPEDPTTWLIGVQWHPEMAPGDEVQNRLFTAFIEAARTPG